MKRQSVPLSFGASFFMVLVGVAAASERIAQTDLVTPESVTSALRSEIGDPTRASAKQLFALGLKYRERAEKDGNWAPAAKAFGESALLYPSPLTLMQYADCTLQATSRMARAEGAEEPSQQLEGMLPIYDSAIVADKILHELTSDQRAQVIHYRNCLADYLRDRQAASRCLPLQWLRIPPNSGDGLLNFRTKETPDDA